MRIAYAVFDITWNGGVERYLRMLGGRFSAAGHEVHVFSSRIPREEGPVVYRRVPAAKGLPFWMRYRRFAAAAARAIRDGRFDIVHSQGSDLCEHDVVTAHNCHRSYLEVCRRESRPDHLLKLALPSHRLFLTNERRNLSRGSEVIAVSPGLKDELLRWYPTLAPEKVTVIENGVDPEAFAPAVRTSRRTGARAALGLKDDDFAVLFVANDARRKGLGVLMRALRLLGDGKAVLIAAGSLGGGWHTPAARIAGGIRKVIVPATADVAALYAAGDLFVLPSRYEAYGLVVTEAMASGLPVLVSRRAGTAPLVGDPRLLLDDPSDARETAAKIAALMDRRELLDEAGRLMRERAAQRTWDDVARETMAVYERIRGERKK